MATTTVAITPGTGQAIRGVTNSGVDGGALQQVLSLAGPDGVLAPSDPDGTLQVAQDSKALFLDAFDGTLGNFTTGGTAPTVSGGMATTASNTTASTSSYLRSTVGFLLRPQAYLRAGTFVQFTETSTAIANNTRWWGYGQNQGTPTAAAPVLNGAVFMIDYAAGALIAAIYSAGTRTQSVTLTRPTDGALHKYEVWFRQAIVYFLIDGVTVATASLPNTAVTSGMYLIAGSTNHTTAPSTAPVLRLSSMSMADTSGTVNTLGDGAIPGIQASVKSGNTTPVSSDNPLVVSLHPSSNGLAAGTNRIGSVVVGPSTTPLTSFYTSTTTNAATVAKSSAGDVQALVISNTSGSAQWVKLYNATSVTLGTTAAVVDIQVAAGATYSLATGPNGLRLPTGIAYAVTGATGATNNTAGAGGVLVALTYM